MPHQFKTRSGWSGEILARHILSKISFITSPMGIAHDVGTDYYCTLFHVKPIDGKPYLLPRNTFAIQVKTTQTPHEAFEISKEYIDGLGLPFFVGHVDLSALKLRVYSGEYLPLLFSYRFKTIDTLKIKPCEERPKDFCNSFTQKGANTFILKFPFLLELSATEEWDELATRSDQLSDECTRLHAHIASRRLEDHLYHARYADGREVPQVFTGRDSFKVFRRNLLGVLVEVLQNLLWGQAAGVPVSLREFEAYGTLLRQLESEPAYRIPYLAIARDSYAALKKAVQGE